MQRFILWRIPKNEPLHFVMLRSIVRTACVRHTLRIISDLYLTSNRLIDLKKMMTSRNTNVVAVLGDVTRHGSEGTHFREGMEVISDHADHVLLVLGDREQISTYEPWAGYFYAEKACKGLDNVTIMHNKTVSLYGVKYVGSTLWTYFPSWSRKYSMKSHPCEEIDTFNNEHKRCVKFIEKELDDANDDKTIVLTHHPPVITNFASDADTYLYGSDQSQLISKHAKNLLLWAHGHLPFSSFNMVHNVPVIGPHRKGRCLEVVLPKS